MAETGPSRRRWLGWLVLGVVVASIVGYLAGSRVRSPQDVLADTAAPGDSLLTAEVRSGAIDASETFAGTVRWRSTRAVSLTRPEDGGMSVVTATPLNPGADVRPGTVLIEISDRPVIVLSGAVPMLRDLHLGDTGADVRRLQDGLRGTGHYDGESDGVFGSATLDALENLYDETGYTVPETAPEQPAEAEEGDAPEPDGAGAEKYAAAAEIVFVPTLPATLLGYPAAVGSPTAETVAELGVGGLVVRLDIPTTWRSLVRPDATQPARFAIRAEGKKYAGALVGVGRARVVDGEGEVLPVTIRTRGRELDAELAGSKVDVTLTDPAAGSGLLVPLSALYTAADLGDFVRVHRDDEPARVAVRVVTTGDGTAVVEAVDPGALGVGDRVVVGVERAGG